MYNRYIPQDAPYGPVSAQERGPRGPESGPSGLGGLLRRLLRGESGGGADGAARGLSALLKRLHLEELDAGDLLLALIVLLLVLEDGDELDLIITLGLTILLSLGES